jgi:hypothetical protein
LSSTPQFNGEQLAGARNERWHQGGDALLTLEAAREWVGELGLVLFAPRAHQLATPAPSLVEATLGRAASAPTAAETEAARGLVARMTADGSAVPLNLLGSAGDVPDFVVSAQAFSYVFTLRGDKSWKQPPGTSGAGNVSPLALKVYEALVAGNALTARELVSELGREVTESAIVRALGELWMQLRVIPLLQQDGAATMWELTSRRFTKQIKAGANAGLPTALSAVISLYLAQVYVATEEEIETFLSPLTARSKVRDVLHGLTAARQLENAVLEGKTLLYIPGALPEFPEIVAAEPVAAEGEIAAAAAVMGGVAGEERIRKFDRPRTPRPPREDRGERPFRKTGGDRGGPAKPFGERGPRKPFGERKPYARAGGRSEGRTEGRAPAERERRPFQRDRAEGARPSFARPWDEERKPRPRSEEGERPASKRPPYRKAEEGRGGEKREFRSGPRKSGPDRGPREERPFRPRREGEPGGFASRPAKTFRPRREGEGAGARPAKTFRPRREGEREGFASRPAKPHKARGEGDRAGFGSRPAKPFRPRREGEREGFASRPAKPYKARGEGDRTGFGSRPAKPFRPRREGEREGFASRPSKPFRPRPEGEREGFSSRPSKPYKARGEGDRGTAEKRPYRRAEGSDRPRPTGDRKPGGKPGFGGKATFGAKKKFGGDRKFTSAGKAAGKSRFGAKPKPKFGAKSGDSKGGKTGGPRTGTAKPRPKAEE